MNTTAPETVKAQAQRIREMRTIIRTVGALTEKCRKKHPTQIAVRLIIDDEKKFFDLWLNHPDVPYAESLRIRRAAEKAFVNAEHMIQENILSRHRSVEFKKSISELWSVSRKHVEYVRTLARHGKASLFHLKTVEEQKKAA